MKRIIFITFPSERAAIYRQNRKCAFIDSLVY